MEEFGSDFHACDYLPLLHCTPDEKWRNGVFFATGRQAINSLIRYRGWIRIWLPRYFCYEVVESIAKTGIEMAFYDDDPEIDDIEAIGKIEFRYGDVLFRVNYFGLRAFRDNSCLNVEVIEDHSHALTGDWIAGSNADWCVASLRKTLPISEGGVIWSPKGHKPPANPLQTVDNLSLADKRFQAMCLKNKYLHGEDIAKDVFRKLYLETELGLGTLADSALASADMDIINCLDVVKWNDQKKKNWNLLYQAFKNKIEILMPESNDCLPFSCIVRGQSLRPALIERAIYPAVLWPVPDEYNRDLLSIHCDGRYTATDIEVMINRIKQCLKS